jgi:hypothetical protein
MAKSWPEASGTNDERQKSRQDAGATREQRKRNEVNDGSQALEACAAWDLGHRQDCLCYWTATAKVSIDHFSNLPASQ